jgi:dephospho-CoA kinase
MKQLILISGKKGTGKDTLSLMFRDKGFAQVAFADVLKEQLHEYLNTVLEIPVFGADLYTDKDKLIGNKFSEEKRTVREWLQQYGQFAKSMFGKNYWADVAIDTVQRLYPRSDVVISDTRFPYEIQRVKEVLGNKYAIHTIKIKRNTGFSDKDISETALDDWEDADFDFVVDNNGTVDDLKAKFIEIALKTIPNPFLR